MKHGRAETELTAAGARARLRAAALRALLFTLALTLLPACGGGGGDDNADAPRWIVLGSSTAAGAGATPGLSWAARLQGALQGAGVVLDNRAVSGATTYHALPAGAARPPGRPATDPAQDVAAALQDGPRVLVLAFPSNDAVSGFAAAESTTNLLLMRERALQRGVAVVVLSSQPRNDADAPARAAMQATDAALAVELGGCFVAVHAALADAGDGIAAAYSAGDGVHLNDAGHGLVFDHLWSAISAGGCVRRP